MSNVIAPITKAEALAKRSDSFPDFVIESFNELISKEMRGGESSIYQDDVIERIISKRPEYSRGDIFSNGWLDVEEKYIAAGWVVSYHKPAYYEVDGKAYFTFK